MTLHEVLERWAQFQPEKTAVHFQGEDISYAGLAKRVARTSEALVEQLGIGAGDRVAYLGYNRPEMLELLFALARIGAMFVPLNFRLALAEHEDILRHADARAIVVDAEFADTVESLRQTLPTLQVTGIEDVRRWGREKRAKHPEALGREQDPVLLVYTSGTTGRPKGVVHTQGGVIWNAIIATHCHELTGEDHVLTALPMFHVGGLCIQTIPALHAGATVTLHQRFDSGRWIADVAQRKPTLSLLVPATIKAIVEHTGWAKADLSSLRAVFTGSSTIPPSLFPHFHARGIPLAQVYGATESGPVSIYLRAADAMRKVGSAGKAGIHCNVRLVDDDGRQVTTGAVGEIQVRAPSLMQGYWKDAHNPAFEDGWFKTGDLARQDEEGFYWVVGRSKDMIITGGENVYPAEVEHVLAACEDIVESAVVGVPDERWGEAAVAVIIRRPSSALDEAAVLKLFEGRLARFKHPRRVVFVDALPKSALGKVQKAELQRELTRMSTIPVTRSDG
jgi:fatty-acyl-CoA synthase